VIYAVLDLVPVQGDILVRCAFNSLSMFGENTKNALLAQFQIQGIVFTADGFDVVKFCTLSIELLGRSSDFLFVKIIDDFCRETGVSLVDSGLSGKTRYVNNSDVLLSLFSKVKDGAFDRRT
jgi:hypothetical protein